MNLTSHENYSKKSTLQKVHDGWENLDEFCTSSKKWTLGHLGVKNQDQFLFDFVTMYDFVLNSQT